MAYNYYSNLKLLTEQAAVAPSATSSYTTPLNSFAMKNYGFYGATQTSEAPIFITPHESTNYGYWGNWEKYKVAENQYYYKSSSSYIPFKFVDKYSAPILKEGDNYNYTFETFYTGDYAQSPYYTLSWDNSVKKIKFQKYSSESAVKLMNANSAAYMEGYGCFILFSAGGGGGGGTGTVTNAGGSGGGGGSTAFVYIDLYELYKNYNAGYIMIKLGSGGTGGVGGANKTGQKGGNGSQSWLYLYDSTTSHTNGNYIIAIRCTGGSGGTWGGNNDKVDGGAGGIAGVVQPGTSNPTLPIFIKLLNSISGGTGGKGGKNNVTAGSNVSTTTYKIPFTSSWKTPAEALNSTTLTLIGYGSNKINYRGGGGASAISVNSAGYGQGGTGGAKRSAGNAGAGGGLIIFKNYFL